MANYNHEILVNYLRDVYSMELLVRKIEDDIHSTREDIQCEQALVEKVESTPIPAEGNISPKKDITPYMIAGFLILFISFGFFTLPSIGAISGILGIGVSIILFSCAGSVSSDNTKMQEEEKEKIKENFQRDVEEYEHMLALANDCRSVLPSQIDDYNAAVSHLQEAKEKLQSVYSVNIIPNKYRSVYVAYYLYDYISSSHETDIDRVLQTMLLEQIIAKLDKIIAQQEEIILNQRMQLAKQDALLAQSKKQHNVALNTGGVTNATFGMALHEMPIMVPVAFVLEFFVVEKLATALAFTFMRPTDRPQFITYAISLMIVCIMCPVMSLVATLLFKEPSFGTWVHTWGCNFPMALCWQMFYCGPLSRFIFRAIFRKQLQAENQEQH